MTFALFLRVYLALVVTLLTIVWGVIFWNGEHVRGHDVPLVFGATALGTLLLWFSVAVLMGLWKWALGGP